MNVLSIIYQHRVHTRIPTEGGMDSEPGPSRVQIATYRIAYTGDERDAETILHWFGHQAGHDRDPDFKVVAYDTIKSGLDAIWRQPLTTTP